MTWVAVGAMVAAAALSAYNANNTARKQDRAVSQGILARMQATRDQSAAMQKTLASLRDSNAKPAVQAANASYLKTLASAGPMGTQPATVGAQSEAYRQAAGAASDASANQAKTTAGLMAVTDAPAIQRQGEGMQIGQLTAALQRMGIHADDASNEAMLKAKGVRPNPWIDLASAALRGYAAGAAGGGGGATTSASEVQSPSSAGYYSGGDFTTGNYTGPGSMSTNYAGNVRNLYGVG